MEDVGAARQVKVLRGECEKFERSWTAGMQF